MGFAYSVTLTDPSNLGGANDSLMVADLNAALNDWSHYIAGNGRLVVNLIIATTPVGRAAGGATSYPVFGRGPNGTTLTEASSKYELVTGHHAPGDVSDITIIVDPVFIPQLFLNPNPGNGAAVPGNLVDAGSVFRHEIGHGLGIIGYRNQDGTLPNGGQFLTLFDQYVRINPDGTASFTGPNTEAVFGGPVTLTTNTTTENYYHLANNIGDPLGQDLMNGQAFFYGKTYDISAVDVAMLSDIGVPVVNGVISAPFTWKTGLDGDWAVASDWDVGAVPNSVLADASITTSGHTVTIAAGETFTVHSLTLNSGRLVVNGGLTSSTVLVAGGTLEVDVNQVTLPSLTLGFSAADATLGGTGTVTVTNLSSSNGTMSGPGRTVAKGATLISPDFFGLALNRGRTFENQGTMTIAGDHGAGPLNFGYAGGAASDGVGTFVNDAGAVLDEQTDGRIATNSFDLGYAGSIQNAGLIKKSGGAGTSWVFVPVINTGTLESDSGTLEFSSGGSSSASGMKTTGSGVLAFGNDNLLPAPPGPAFTITGGSFANVASLLVDGGRLILTGPVTGLAAPVTVNKFGLLDLGSNNVSVPSLSAVNGAINGTGTLTVTGALSSNDGTMAGLGRTVARGTVSVTGGLNLTGGRTFENQGIITIASGAGIYFGYSDNPAIPGGGANTLMNDFGAVLDVRFDGTAFTTLSASNSIVNAGLVKKTAGPGVSTVRVPVINTGALESDIGTLDFEGGGSFAGTIAGSGTIAIGGVSTLSSGQNLTVANLFVTSSGTVTSGSSGISIGNGGTCSLTVQTSGSLSSANGIIVGVDGTGFLIDNAGTVNAGNLLEIGDLAGGNGSVVVNGGVITAAVAQVGTAGGGALTVSNGGTVTLTSSATATIGTFGTSAGTVTVAGTGSLLQGQYVLAGQSGSAAVTVQNGARMTLIALGLGGMNAPSGGTGSLSLMGASDASIAGALYLWNGSTISLDATSGIDVGVSGSYAAGTILVEAGRSLTGSGKIAGAVFNNGVVAAADGGSLEITGALTGSGSVVLGNATSLTIGGPVGSGETITFSTAPATLTLNAPGSGLSAAIANLAGGDKVEFNFAAGVRITSVTAAGSAVTVQTSAGNYVLSNVGFAPGSSRTFNYGRDVLTGDAFIALPAASALTVALARDTGISSSDGITANPALRGLGTPGAVVTVMEGNSLLGTTSVDPSGLWSFTPALADGAHTIVASAPGASPATLTFTLDTDAPNAPAITGIASIAGTLTVSGTAEAGGVVSLLDGVTPIGSATVTLGGTWSVAAASPPAQGTHGLSARVTDAAGQISVASAPGSYLTGLPSGLSADQLYNRLSFGSGNNVVFDSSLAGNLFFGDGDNVVTSTGDLKILVFGSGSNQVTINSTASARWQSNWISAGASTSVNAAGGFNSIAIGRIGTGGRTSFSGSGNNFEALGTSGYTAGDEQGASGNQFHLYQTASTNLVLHGSNDMAFISERSNPTITDSGSGLKLYVSEDAGNIAIQGWAGDPTAQIQLTTWSGYKDAQAAFAALVSDGLGGLLLPVPRSGNSIDFANVGAGGVHLSQIAVAPYWTGGVLGTLT